MIKIHKMESMENAEKSMIMSVVLMKSEIILMVLNKMKEMVKKDQKCGLNQTPKNSKFLSIKTRKMSE